MTNPTTTNADNYSAVSKLVIVVGLLGFVLNISCFSVISADSDVSHKEKAYIAWGISILICAIATKYWAWFEYLKGVEERDKKINSFVQIIGLLLAFFGAEYTFFKSPWK